MQEREYVPTKPPATPESPTPEQQQALTERMQQLGVPLVEHEQQPRRLVEG
jgi:hypothetical protein